MDRVIPPRELKWPCYDVEINHHFQGLDEHVEELKQLVGPIWDIPDRKHHFEALEKSVDQAKKLFGPIFQIDNNHHFQQIIEHAEKLTKLYAPGNPELDNRKHHFVAIQQHVDLAKKLLGPIYDVNVKHNYGGRFAAGLLAGAPVPTCKPD